MDASKMPDAHACERDGIPVKRLRHWGWLLLGALLIAPTTLGAVVDSFVAEARALFPAAVVRPAFSHSDHDERSDCDPVVDRVPASRCAATLSLWMPDYSGSGQFSSLPLGTADRSLAPDSPRAPPA